MWLWRWLLGVCVYTHLDANLCSHICVCVFLSVLHQEITYLCACFFVLIYTSCLCVKRKDQCNLFVVVYVCVCACVCEVGVSGAPAVRLH